MSSLISSGKNASPATLYQAALFNGAGGYLASLIYRTVGIFTVAQAIRFGPHSPGGFARGLLNGSTNSTAILRQSIASSAWGAGSYFFPADHGK